MVANGSVVAACYTPPLNILTLGQFCAMALSGIISERGSDSLILDSSGRYRGETIVHNCEPQDLFRAIVLRKYTKKLCTIVSSKICFVPVLRKYSKKYQHNKT